ncbi:MAG: hypothetical protein K940chlam1_00650 [Candidatus Anoxychlamydiales bacterium]|nr:hypothetical protein [Candidatus Anoxychlamydiales bacterium]NGX36166.1 hypothetical protein [Candidatus Anoxychlamydiales bacterium]
MFVATILALLGLALIYLEFFLPGAIFAIGGTLLLLSSLFLLIVGKTKLFYFVLYTVFLLSFVLVVIKVALKKLRANKHIFLQSDQAGYKAAAFKKDLIGQIGLSSTDLRPSGKIYINDKYYPAISKENYIERGKKIKVIAGEGATLIVKELIAQKRIKI